jgi:glycosyltransferase involved in cell wall biosynthesis
MDGIRSPLLRKLGCNFGVAWADWTIFKSPIPTRLAGRPKILHLPNGVNSDHFQILSRSQARDRLGLSQDKFYVLFVSSKDKLRPQKRYDRFLDVLHRLQAAHPNLAIEELVLVNQDRSRVVSYFNAANLHLLTSDYEGSPNSVKEALSCGIPVVTTSVGNVREMLAGVPGCHVSDSFAVDELAELAGRVLSISVNRERVRSEFLSKGLSQERVATKLTQLYASAVLGMERVEMHHG